jgi:tetratricopeptide (TPR) repeat protein
MLSFRGISRRLASLRPQSIVQAFRVLIAYVPAALAALALVWQVGTELFDSSLAVEPISVPSSLDGRGYTPAVVAQKLSDAVGTIMSQATTRMKRERVAVGSVDPDALIPASNSQFAAFVSSALHFFHLSSRTYVSGEITEMNGRYSLTLRMGGHMSASRTAGPAGNPDILFAAAAREIIWRTQPFVLASADYAAKNPSKAKDEADAIIATYPENDPNVALAHNLKGNIHLDENQRTAAESEYREAMRLAPKLGTPHYNLGNLYLDEGKNEKAIEEYNTALAIEPDFALPHLGLGNAFSARKRTDDAIDQFRLAIALDPRAAYAHSGLGQALIAHRDPAQGLKELQIAVSLSPSDPVLHYELANALKARKDWDGAMSEYRAAIALAPNQAYTHFWLADAIVYKIQNSPNLDEASLVKLAGEVCDEASAAARLQQSSQYYATRAQIACSFDKPDATPAKR